MPLAISDDETSEVEMSIDMPTASKQASLSAQKSRGRRAVNCADAGEDKDEDDTLIKSDLKNGSNNEAKAKEAEDDEEDDEDAEDLEEDEYVVEKILSHIIDEEGLPRFEVKWEGFEKKSDRTWEPEENLIGNASQILEDYFTSIGGRENLEEAAKALKGKKRGRPSAGASTPTGCSVKRSRRNGDHPADTESPASLRAAQFKPPTGSWENDVDVVDMYRENDGALMVYLTWKTGERTHHPAKQAYRHCPQKILGFYESRINFKA